MSRRSQGVVMSESLTRHDENQMSREIPFRGCQRCAKLECRATFSKECHELTLTRHNEHQMYRETPVSRLSMMRETGVSRDIFKGDKSL